MARVIGAGRTRRKEFNKLWRASLAPALSSAIRTVNSITWSFSFAAGASGGWTSDGKVVLMGNGESQGAALRGTMETVVGHTYKLSFNATLASLDYFRIGTSANGTQIQNFTVIEAGLNVATFVATTTVTHFSLYINSTQAVEYSDIKAETQIVSLYGTALNKIPYHLNPKNAVLSAGKVTSVPNASGVANTASVIGVSGMTVEGTILKLNTAEDWFQLANSVPLLNTRLFIWMSRPGTQVYIMGGSAANSGGTVHNGRLLHGSAYPGVEYTSCLTVKGSQTSHFPRNTFISSLFEFEFISGKFLALVDGVPAPAGAAAAALSAIGLDVIGKGFDTASPNLAGSGGGLGNVIVLNVDPATGARPVDVNTIRRFIAEETGKTIQMDPRYADPSPRTIGNITWTFTNPVDNAAGFLANGAIYLLYANPNAAWAIARVPTVAGKTYRCTFTCDNSVTIRAGTTAANTVIKAAENKSAGTHVVDLVAQTTEMFVQFLHWAAQPTLLTNVTIVEL